MGGDYRQNLQWKSRGAFCKNRWCCFTEVCLKKKGGGCNFFRDAIFLEVHFFREVCFKIGGAIFFREVRFFRGGVKKEERLICFFSTWLAIKDMALSGNKLLLLESCRQTRVNMQGGQASEGVSGNQASISTDKCLAVNLLPESMHLCMSTHVIYKPSEGPDRRVDTPLDLGL